MTTSKQVQEIADIMVKSYGKEKAILRCQAKIEIYKERVKNLPKNMIALNGQFSDQLMLEFFKNVSLRLQTSEP